MGGKNGNGEGSVRQRKDGRWEATCTVRVDGDRQIRKSVYGKTRLEAVGKLREVQASLSKGGTVIDERVTLETFLTYWLEQSVRPRNRPRTYESYAYLVNSHIVPSLGNVKIAKLTVNQVQVWLNEKEKSGLSGNTVQRMRAVLRRAMRMAEKWGYVHRNVVALTDPPAIKKHRATVLEPEQAVKFLVVTSEHRWSALFSVALAVGLRLGEALGLRWQDIDLEEGCLRVNYQLQRARGGIDGAATGLVLSEPKSSAGLRTVPIAGFAVQALKDHKWNETVKFEGLEGRLLKPDDYVFTGNTCKPLDPRNVNRTYKRLLDAAGLPDLRFHDLRHTCATLLLAQGVNPKEVQEILGHSNIRMTMDIYGHAISSAKRNAADLMDGLLRAKK